MEHYLTCPYASMMMEDSESFRTAIGMALAEVDAVIETGTHLGTGSTRIIAECIVASGRDIPLHTIEANAGSHAQAVANTQHFGFVNCILGCSLNPEAAAEFILNDEVLLNHQDYTGVYIDGDLPGDQMAAGYLNETTGSIHDPVYKTEMLAELIHAHSDKNLLIVLDSAGGLGLLEFQETLRLMEGRNFWLCADDTHHIKHYRSVLFMKAAPEKFTIIDEDNGWIVAKVKGA